MKKVLAFKFPFYRFAGLDFYNCYASVYLFLQGAMASNSDYYCQAMEKKRCNECWNCADSLQEKSERLNQLFGMIFDGSWTTQRNSWSGEQTSIQRELAAKYSDFESKVASEMEFLAGFTGYSYERIAGAGVFKESVVAAIDAGKPVIAKVRADESFRVIMGYDGDVLIEPDYRPIEHPPGANDSITYDSIDYLYVIGEKVEQKYTFVDVLKAMERVMGSDFADDLAYEIRHHVFSGNVCDLPVGEVKVRFDRFRELMDLVPNLGHGIRLPFGDEELLRELGVDVDQYLDFFATVREQGHLLHERGYMLTALSTSIIDLELDDTDKFPWNKHGLVNAAAQIFDSVIECDLKILLAVKKAICQLSA